MTQQCLELQAEEFTVFCRIHSFCNQLLASARARWCSGLLCVGVPFSLLAHIAPRNGSIELQQVLGPAPYRV